MKKIQVIIFKKREDEILYLLLKRIKSRGGFWQPITGRMEKDESLIEAAKREVTEEIGITEIKKWITDVHKFIVKEDKSLEIVFGAEIESKSRIDIKRNIYQEHDEMKWVPYKEALSLLKWKGNKEGLKRLNEILSKK